MCYYVTSRLSASDIFSLEHDFVVKWQEEETTPYFVAAGFAYPRLPAITAEHNFRLLNWGLVASWQKDWAEASKFRMQTLNAVSDTIHSKPSFRNAVKHGRMCVVPVNGYFEWHDAGGAKYPFFIYPRNNALFLLAGLYEYWTNPASAETMCTFSIVTTAANERMSWIHNLKKRMPAILSTADAKTWLDKGVPFDRKKELLKPYSQQEMADHSISRLITSRKQNPNSPAVVEPFVYPELSHPEGEEEGQTSLFD